MSGAAKTVRNALAFYESNIKCNEGFTETVALHTTMARDALDALVSEAETLRTALEQIAGYDSHNEENGCHCGHKMMFCHIVNAERYCGGATAAIAKHALGKCPPVCMLCIREDAARAALSGERT